jgi:hypothetical protein
MTGDPYRPPDAPLEDAHSERRPRSLVAAVVLGYVAEAALGGVVVVGAIFFAALPSPAELLRQGPTLTLLAAFGGLWSGWVAARYRRDTWLDTSLCLIALDALPTLAFLAWLLVTQTKSPSAWALGRPLVHAITTLAGGRLGWRPR